MIPTMIGISIIIFLMVRLLPGDIVAVLAGADVGSDPELIQQAREQLRTQVAQLALAGAEQVLLREIDAAKHKDVLDKLSTRL